MHGAIYHLIFMITVVASFTACGSDTGGGGNSTNSEPTYGAYVMQLTFPEDVPTRDASAGGGIDCDAADIAVLRIRCFNADNVILKGGEFRCNSREGTLDEIPTGTNLRIVVTAEDSADQVVLAGESSSVTILPDETTTGEPIHMTLVSDEVDRDGDGVSAYLDCNDDDPNISPEAPEIPGNAVDENCDGLAEGLPAVDEDYFTITELGLNMTFVYIPPDTFLMGSPESEVGRRAGNETQHLVSISQGFYMQETEVTQAQWLAVMGGNNPSRFYDCGLDCPVERVPWSDIQTFIDEVNNLRADDGYTYRLPTEAQWEYAARGGAQDAEPYAGENLDALGWYRENSFEGIDYDNCDTHSVGDGRCRGTHPVKQKLANGFGLYDMHGNVFEWCSDWFDDSYGSDSLSLTDPVVDPEVREPNDRNMGVMRGGAWGAEADRCRSAYRYDRPRGDNAQIIGFRIVAEPTGE